MPGPLDSFTASFALPAALSLALSSPVSPPSNRKPLICTRICMCVWAARGWRRCSSPSLLSSSPFPPLSPWLGNHVLAQSHQGSFAALLMSMSVPAAGEKDMGLCVAKARLPILSLLGVWTSQLGSSCPEIFWTGRGDLSNVQETTGNDVAHGRCI